MRSHPPIRRPERSVTHIGARQGTDRSAPPLLSLVPTLRCPNPDCGRLTYKAETAVGYGFHQCENKHCGQRWWAMLLEEGPVLPQLIWAFEDRTMGELQMAIYEFPDELEAQAMWQIPLTGNEYIRARGGRAAATFRALGLLPERSLRRSA